MTRRADAHLLQYVVVEIRKYFRVNIALKKSVRVLAKANGVEPWRYLEAVFERLPSASSKQDIEALLPWRIELREHQDDGARVSSS